MSGATDDTVTPDGLTELTTVVRRVVANRVADRDATDEIVQETIARLLATRRRLDDGALRPYAVVVARNLVASRWRRLDTGKRNEHRLFDPGDAVPPEDRLIAQEEVEAVRAALDRLQPHERELVVAHEVAGQDTRSLADAVGSTPAAIAAQLNRTRARLRVEYLVELHGTPPSAQCRPVLLAVSAGDRRRQVSVDAGYHVLDCDFCATLMEPLLDRRAKPADEELTVTVRVDSDIVDARQHGRDVTTRAGFSATEATVIATAISEVARNIVRFARRGTITMTVVADGDSSGIMVVARDAGPGIPDVQLAMSAGYTTYGGRGLGLPGSRRLMDEFEITSEVGHGTTVTMTKWHRT